MVKVKTSRLGRVGLLLKVCETFYRSARRCGNAIQWQLSKTFGRERERETSEVRKSLEEYEEGETKR